MMSRLAKKMSYGAPWEWGISAADTMPLCDMEVPGLVPDVSEIELNMKELKPIAKALLLDSGLSPSFWACTLCTAAALSCTDQQCLLELFLELLNLLTSLATAPCPEKRPDLTSHSLADRTWRRSYHGVG